MNIMIEGENMERCESYHEYEVFYPQHEKFSECWGTKERERCSCEGDPSKCDFYKRKVNNKMNTAEMWLKAQEDGKIYRVVGGDMVYDRCRGFFNEEVQKPWRVTAFDDIDQIFGLEWEESKEPRMTIEEAEKKFGIKIVG